MVFLLAFFFYCCTECKLKVVVLEAFFMEFSGAETKFQTEGAACHF